MTSAKRPGALSCAALLERVLRRALQRARPDVDLDALGGKLPVNLGVRRSALGGRADYQSSLPLLLGNRWRSPPSEIAHDMLQHVREEGSNDTQLVQDAFVSKEGFVNLILSDQWLAHHMFAMATDGVMPSAQDAQTTKSILVDFCSPNFGKRLHVGHLRSSVLGDAISNLLEFRGHRVRRVSHAGDVGSAFATLLAELMESRVSLETLSEEQMGRLYEAGKKRIVSDRAFKDKVDALVLQLQRLGGKANAVDPLLKSTWQRACDVSRDSISRTLKRLNVTVHERAESTYLHLVPGVLAQLRDSGVAELSRGALCIFVDGPNKPPMLIQKQDSGYLYATLDLACLFSRIRGFAGVDATCYDEIVYVTDQSQRHHFQQLFKAADQAGWLKRGGDRADVKVVHAWCGLVLGKDGTKLSSRNGACDYLEELLDRAGTECRQRSLLRHDDIAATDPLLYERLGDSAVRYFELAQHRERSYKFDFDHALQLKGNTGVYLMYACVRLQGILRQAQARLRQVDQWAALLADSDAQMILTNASFHWTKSERALVLLLGQFDDEVALSAANLQPHVLCDYLFRVASQFHVFYEQCRVLDDPQQDARLLLCAATHAILHCGLQLIGLQEIERM